MNTQAVFLPMLIWIHWMKAISQKQPRLRHRLPREEEKLNKTFFYIPLQKAGFIACLFIFSLTENFGQTFFDQHTKQAYDLTLHLNFDEARKLNVDPKSPLQQYVAGLGDALELLLTEDESLFNAYEDRFESRQLKNPKTYEEQFLQAELHLQWTFVYLKFGHELDAASNFREAYKIASACRKKFPQQPGIQKTLGLMEIMIGSVPEKYNWVMELFGMRGTIENGLKHIDAARNSADALALEADLYYCLVYGYILQQPDIATTEITKLIEKNPDHPTLLLAGAALASKNNQSEIALPWLMALTEKSSSLRLYYPNYLLGEVCLHKGEYDKAITQYKLFTENFKGENNLKDAWFKMGLCTLLKGDTKDAEPLFTKAKTIGKEEIEADKSAARTLSEKMLPNVQLSKARYATDGGYYDQARTILSNVSNSDLKGKKEQVEFYYRKARLEHKTSHAEAARLFYQQVIDMAGDEHWYFAPNSCLQLGYLMIAEGNKTDAKKYFKKALSYPKHEYKNSIDSKAKTALNRL